VQTSTKQQFLKTEGYLREASGGVTGKRTEGWLLRIDNIKDLIILLLKWFQSNRQVAEVKSKPCDVLQ
jgi:hypothetical protein